jgi:hypothetical protein
VTTIEATPSNAAEQFEFVSVAPSPSHSVISISSANSSDAEYSLKESHNRKRNQIRKKFKTERTSESSDFDHPGRVTRKNSNSAPRGSLSQRARLRKSK